MSKKQVRYSGVCRNCQAIEAVAARDWYRASPPRCRGCGAMLDKGPRVFKQSPIRRAKSDTAFKRWTRDSMKDVQCLLPVVKRVGKRHGVQVHWADNGHHVWFNYDGRRILEFWPSKGFARATGIKRQLQGVGYALDLAVELLCRDRSRPKLDMSQFPNASRIQTIS